MASQKIYYAASQNMTVTALASMATSSDWRTGWTSDLIDNTTNLYLDYLISGKIVAGGTAAAGQIRISLYAMMDDSTWVDIFSSGTEGAQGAATILDVATRDNSLVLARALTTTTTASQVYPWGPLSVASCFGGIVPAKFSIFIAHSLANNLAASGAQVTYKGVYATVA
jgi:hypothetical protein